jgi:hypothetical protein
VSGFSSSDAFLMEAKQKGKKTEGGKERARLVVVAVGCECSVGGSSAKV